MKPRCTIASKLYTAMLLGLAWLVTLNAGALAQQDNSPKRGTNPGGAYAISDIENISLSNGNLMFNIPLAQLPASRGAMSTGVSLVYNGKLWDTVTEYVDNPNGVLGGNYPYTIVQTGNGGGWSLASGYWVEVKTKPNQYTTSGPCGPYQYGDPDGPPAPVGYVEPDGYYRFKVIVHFPDGSTHEMTPYGFSFPNGVGTDGWSNVYGSGVTVSCQGFNGLEYGPGATFYSTDGSYLRLVVNPTTAGNSWSRNWTLYAPDGTKVETTNSGQKLYDRNNNFVNVGGSDQLGRQITTTNVGADGNQYVSQLGFGGQTLTWTIHWKTIWVYKPYKAYNDFFNNGIPADGGNRELFASLFVVDKVTLPSQLGSQEMLFSYDGSDVRPLSGQYTTGWGNLTQCTLLSPPSEAVSSRGKVVYSYSTANVLATIHPEDFTNVAVTQKALTYRQEYDGSYQTDTWTYNILPELGSGSVSGPGGTGSGQSSYPDYMGAFAGLVYRSTDSGGAVIEKKWLSVNQSPTATSPVGYNPYVKTEFVSIPNAAGTLALTAIKDFTVDQNGNVRTVTEYDYVPYSSVPRDQYGKPTGIPASAIPVRTTEMTYQVNAPLAGTGVFTVASDNYLHPNAPRVLNAIATSRLRIGGPTGPTVAYSEMTFDNPRTTANQILVRTWDSTKGGLTTPLTTSNSTQVQAQFDQFGNPTLLTDARGVQTQMVYGQVGSYTNLYPTEVRNAYQTTVQRTKVMEYDFWSGRATQTTDVENGLVNTTTYDAIGRILTDNFAVGTPQARRVRYEYLEAQRLVVSRGDLESFGDEKRVSVRHFDQLGAEWLTRNLEDSSQSPTNPTVGIKVQSRRKYVSTGGMLLLTSNPFVAATPEAATAEPGMGWTVSTADRGGRTVSVQTFAGAALPAPWGNNSSSTGTVTTVYDGQYVTVTDQTGKVRRSFSDAFGRTLRVDEPNAGGQLGAVSTPNQATTYQYNVQGNMTGVIQGGQSRSFVYDSLSRLTSSTTPEAGTTTYTYDAGGNPLTRTDSRGVVISSQYDELNRMKLRSYTLPSGVGVTSTDRFVYDGNESSAGTIPYAKGRLTKIVNDNATSEIRGFDAAGRVTSARQTIDGINYDTSYTYNLNGSLLTETYPSGRVTTHSYASNGDLAGVSGRPAGGTNKTYASGFEYAAQGAVTKFQYGNGLWEETGFNSLMQPTSITLRKQATTLWNVSYDYGTSDNNGNIKSQSILHPGITQPLVQNYTYDSLNRLSQAVETQNGVEQWKQTFTYDRFGNRTVVAGQTTPSLVGPNPVINQANNRITPQAGEGYGYDSAGNLTFDKDGKKFVFDANNRVTQFFQNQTSQTPVAEYRYDATGKRVKKIVGNVTTIFVYDGFGNLISEYSINGQTLTPRTQFLTVDRVSSQRVISDSQGTVTSRRDFAPFGEELPTSTPRPLGQGYGSSQDRTRQKFGTYERDEESGLDFAQARYYQANSGRFTSVDSAMGSGHATDPQTWNRYAYVKNNPVNKIDPDGLYPRDQHEFITFLMATLLKRPDARDIAHGAGDADSFRHAATGLFGLGVIFNWKKHFGKPLKPTELATITKGYDLGFALHLVEDNSPGGPHRLWGNKNSEDYSFLNAMGSILVHTAYDIASLKGAITGGAVKSPDRDPERQTGWEAAWVGMRTNGEIYPKNVIEGLTSYLNDNNLSIGAIRITTADAAVSYGDESLWVGATEVDAFFLGNTMVRVFKPMEEPGYFDNPAVQDILRKEAMHQLSFTEAGMQLYLLERRSKDQNPGDAGRSSGFGF